jgi:hypothetical protein
VFVCVHPIRFVRFVIERGALPPFRVRPSRRKCELNTNSQAQLNDRVLGHSRQFGGLAQSFEPPSTWIISPSIQRSSSGARKATTPPISSGCVRRLNACMPSTRSRPAFVLVKLDVSVSAGRHRINPDPAGAKQRGKMLHQRVNSVLGCCIGWDRPNNVAGRQRCDKNDTASFPATWQRPVDRFRFQPFQPPLAALVMWLLDMRYLGPSPRSCVQSPAGWPLGAALQATLHSGQFTRARPKGFPSGLRTRLGTLVSFTLFEPDVWLDRSAPHTAQVALLKGGRRISRDIQPSSWRLWQ